MVAVLWLFMMAYSILLLLAFLLDTLFFPIFSPCHGLYFTPGLEMLLLGHSI